MSSPQVQSYSVPCTQKVKAGFMLGFTIGCVIGGVLGVGNAAKSGAKGREFVRIAARSACTAGFSFGGFMTIGTLLRC